MAKMGAAHLVVLVEWLGLSVGTLAAAMDIRPGIVVNWLAGCEAIPAEASDALAQLESEADEAVNLQIARLLTGEEQQIGSCLWDLKVAGRVRQAIPDTAMLFDPHLPCAPTGALLLVARAWLGLDRAQLATLLGTEIEQIHVWETGGAAVPETVATAVARLETQAAEVVKRYVRVLAAAADPRLTTYVDDVQFHAAHPDLAAYPVRWHHAIAARVRHEISGLRIGYPVPLVVAEVVDR